MEDPTEELEPLFDYHRVQPDNFISVDDDDDSDRTPIFLSKRRKINKPTDNKKMENKIEEKETVQVVELDDEEDWLPPPPKNVASSSRSEVDSALKQLRLKKLEYEAIAKSTEDTIRAAEEAAKRALNSSLNSSTEQTVEVPANPNTDRAKINISVQDKAGTKQYRIFADDKFEQLFRKYADKVGINVEKLVFSFDGDKINPACTPQSLGMEDDDLIEVNVKAS